jgi:hypothetical protein
MHDPLLISYLAGAFDVVGYVTIVRTKRTGERYENRPIYYLPEVGPTATDPTVPNLLLDTFRGSIFTHRPARHKPWHMWQASSAAAAKLCHELLPYLRMKREHARLLIQLFDIIKARKMEQRATQKPPYRLTFG